MIGHVRDGVINQMREGGYRWTEMGSETVEEKRCRGIGLLASDLPSLSLHPFSSFHHDHDHDRVYAHIVTSFIV